MNISIIIPTYNEAENIGKLVRFLLANSDNSLLEIIVSDAGSEDDTLQIARQAGARSELSPGKGRSAQMNYGASLSKGDVLYFIHADCFPPAGFIKDIFRAVTGGYDMGRYRTSFHSDKTILQINAWFTRFDLFVCMGGDQTLFVTRSLFEQCQGYNEKLMIMEEYDFCERARKLARYKIMNGEALISARKYEDNSWLRVQLANARIVKMYRNGASQEEILQTYQNKLHYRKNCF